MTRRNAKKASDLTEGEGRRKTGAIMGVDVSKTILSIAIVSEKRLLYEKNHENSKMGIQRIVALCRKYHVTDVGLESTAQYHLKLVFELVDQRISVLVANPKQTKTTEGKKTDKIDARRIAVAHRDGRLRPSIIPSEDLFHFRKSMRTLKRLTEDMTKSKQRLHQLFQHHDFHPKRLFGNFLKSKWSLYLLRQVLVIEDTNYKAIASLVGECYFKQPSKRNQEDLEKLSQLSTELARFRQELYPLEKAVLLTDLTQIALMQQLVQHQRLTYVALARENADVCLQLKQLLSVVGIGPDSASQILAEIVDISYFPHPKNLVKWAGLAPRVNQSGHRKRITGRLHKGGNKHLRRALTLCCTNIYARGNWGHPLYRFMKAHYDKTGNYWAAICAGARKLLVVIWHILSAGETWQPPKLTDPDMLERIQRMVQSKIRIFDRQVQRYQKLEEKISQEIDSLANFSEYRGTDPRELLQVLVASI